MYEAYKNQIFPTFLNFTKQELLLKYGKIYATTKISYRSIISRKLEKGYKTIRYLMFCVFGCFPQVQSIEVWQTCSEVG